MAAKKTVKRVVSHPKLFMRVDGKTVHVEKGTELTLTEDQAEKLEAKLEPVKAQKKVTADSGDKGGESGGAGEAK